MRTPGDAGSMQARQVGSTEAAPLLYDLKYTG